MAKGTDSDGFVLFSRFRTGLKREFQFAMKAQSNICDGSLGRTRGSKNFPEKVPILKSPERKRFRKYGEAKKDMNNDNEENANATAFGIESIDDNVRKETTSVLGIVEEESKKSDVGGSVIINGEEQMNEEEHVVLQDLEKGETGSAPKVDGMIAENSARHFTQSASKPKCDESKVVMSNGEKVNNIAAVGMDDRGRREVANVTMNSTLIVSKMQRRDTLKKFPSVLKELLTTGMLEGLQVKYVRGSKALARRPGDKGLRGVISGIGVLCYCDACNGVKVVSPNAFELHAGSGNKRPPEHIYLENGKTLRDVMNACLGPLDSLEEDIQKVLGGFTMKKSSICLNCRAIKGVSKVLCDSCLVLKDSQPSPIQTPAISKRSVPLAIETPAISNTSLPFTVQPPAISNISVPVDNQSRSLEPVAIPKLLKKGMKRSTSCGKNQGKLTRKDLRLHKLVFEHNALQNGTELRYFAHGKCGQQALLGYKQEGGILCTCCNKKISASQFEAHAGWASRRKPYLHIYTPEGISLHDLSISLMKEWRKLSNDDNDDLCSICQDGGDLLCCDGCPRTFHIDCVPLPCIPSDPWYCKYCQNNFQMDKHGDRIANAPNRRCIRVVKSVEVDHGGCALCRGHHFSRSFGPRTVMICDQCEKEYHVGCLKDHNMQNLEELPEGDWFCGTSCSQIHSTMTNLVVGEKKNLPVPDSLLNAIKKKREEKCLETEVAVGLETGVDVDLRTEVGAGLETGVGAGLDIKWRVLNWKLDNSGEVRKLLSQAVAIFHERFDSIVDSGCDFIPTMLYGRVVKGQDFGRIYCAVLTVNQVVVSAGAFRIFGPEVAELPIVATAWKYQGQGYFQCLFSCIERLLGSLNVRQLVLPAAEEAESLWTNKFGFTRLSEEEINSHKKFYPIVFFQGTSLLQKLVPAAL
ncbi:hypothetical protein RIF29_27593 [Crotalaria pallida]|uniref:PHD-type domain-containing protein n=1 Tax=Crotalaria pallida TaxID=3830 RepID=A0AAN9EPC5_CROPI